MIDGLDVNVCDIYIGPNLPFVKYGPHWSYIRQLEAVAAQACGLGI